MPVAIKIIKKSKLKEDETWEELMKSELEALEQLDHPHIVRVLDLCEDTDHIYIVSELLKQGNLLEVMTKMQK